MLFVTLAFVRFNFVGLPWGFLCRLEVEDELSNREPARAASWAEEQGQQEAVLNSFTISCTADIAAASTISERDIEMD